jgi:predicted esterase
MADFLFATAAELRSSPAFDPLDVIQGIAARPELLPAPGVVRVEVEGLADDLVCYGAVRGNGVEVPLVFFEGDVIQRGNRFRGDVTVGDWYAAISPYQKQFEAEMIASALQRPFVNLARPGVMGSSGDHNERRRPRESALVSVALDELQRTFGWRRFDLAGLSGGGHMVAALMARRADIDIAVIASGNVAVRMRNEAFGLAADFTGYEDFLDPIEEARLVAAKRIILMTDPHDLVVPPSCQSAYYEALRREGAPVEQRFVPAPDPRHHILREAAILAASAARR